MVEGEGVKAQLEMFLAYYQEELERVAEWLAEEEMPQLTDELFDMFAQSGNRLSYEKVYFQRRKMLTVFGVLAILEGEQQDIKKLEIILQDICAEKCWALPAHVNKEQKDWELTIDLFAAETAFYLAEIVGRLGDALDEEIRTVVRQEVFRRVLTPFMQSKSPYAWWEHCEMNWCAVCNGAIGCAAIWMIEDSGILDPFLQRICKGLEHYIAGFCEDGACLEGLGYYTYGMSFYVAFAALVKDYTKGRINLFENPKLREVALFQQKCYLPGGRTVCFADSSSTDEFRMGLTCYLKMYYPEVKLPPLGVAADLESDDCYRYLMISRDFLFTEEYLKYIGTHPDDEEIAAESEEKQILLPQAQWSITTGRSGSVLAIKGGCNEEPHNHNDVGSFFYVADGEMVLAELGVGEYTRDYFGQKRYEQLCCRSLGHNLPLIDGKEQRAGAQYRATAFAGNGQGEAIIEIGHAYPLNEGEQVTRKAVLEPEDGSMWFEDVFSLQKGRVVTENLVTQYKTEVLENGFRVDTGKHRYHITCDSGKAFRIKKQMFRNHQGAEEEVWLMQWEVTGERAKINIRQI